MRAFPHYAVRHRSERLSLTGGVFTRSGEGLYLTSATALGIAASDVRRIGFRGLLLEGGSTNYLGSPSDMGGASWQAAGGGSTTLNDATDLAPDGSATADWIQAPSTYSKFQGALAATIGTKVTGSMWARRQTGAGAGTVQFALQDGGSAGVGAAISTAIAEAWGRYKVTRTIASANLLYYVPGEGRLGAYGTTAQALSYLTVFHQLEVRAYATSVIRTQGARMADNMSRIVGDYPVGLLTRGGRVRIAPIGSSAEILSQNEEMVIAGVSTTDYVSICIDGGAVKVRLVQGGTQRVITGALTFSADQILTVSWEPSGGSITVAGATTGDGTSTGTGAAWSSGTLYIGRCSDGTKPIYAHYTDVEIVGL